MGKIKNSFRLDAFAAVFSTKADNRFYAYEPQLSYAGAFPSFFFHRGLRLVGQCRWKPFDFMQVSARFGLLHYFNKDSIASGPNASTVQPKKRFKLAGDNEVLKFQLG